MPQPAAGKRRSVAGRRTIRLRRMPSLPQSIRSKRTQIRSKGTQLFLKFVFEKSCARLIRPMPKAAETGNPLAVGTAVTRPSVRLKAAVEPCSSDRGVAAPEKLRTRKLLRAGYRFVAATHVANKVAYS